MYLQTLVALRLKLQKFKNCNFLYFQVEFDAKENVLVTTNIVENKIWIWDKIRTIGICFSGGHRWLLRKDTCVLKVCFGKVCFWKAKRSFVFAKAGSCIDKRNCVLKNNRFRKKQPQFNLNLAQFIYFTLRLSKKNILISTF